MARSFNGSSDFIVAGSGATANPTLTLITVAAWLNPSSLTQDYGSGFGACAATFGDDNVLSNLQIGVLNDKGYADFRHVGGLDSKVSTSNAIASANTWNHVAGIFDGTNITADVAIYLNANVAGKGSASSGVASSENVVGVGIGALVLSGVGQFQYYAGAVAELAAWSVGLTTDEIASLAKGYSPLLIRPSSLLDYFPLLGRTSPEIELINGNGGALTGTAAAPHPRIIMPRSPKARRFSSAPALSFVGFMGTSGV